MTEKKKILSIYNEDETLIGFSVLTYKRGGSVKTGPTMFIKNYRTSGYGQIFRRSLDTRLRKEGLRKVYCTSSINNREVISYLLRSDYKIECQLQKHYGMFDELVFGKILRIEKKRYLKYKFPTDASKENHVIRTNVSEYEKKLTAFMQAEFSTDITSISSKIAKKFIKDANRSIDLTYEDKPKKLIFATRGALVSMLCICLPKRGGAIKSVLLSSSSCPKSISKIVRSVEQYANSENRHKLYFTIPEFRQDLVIALKSIGYVNEGALRAPYKKSVDIFMMAKLL